MTNSISPFFILLSLIAFPVFYSVAIASSPKVSIVKDGGNGGFSGSMVVTGVVKAPRAKVWSVLTDSAMNLKLYPEILECVTLARNGNRETQRIRLDFPWPIADRTIIQEKEYDSGLGIIRFHRVGGDVAESDGEWKLSENGTETNIEYTIRFNPDIAFAPRWLTDWVCQKTAPLIIDRIRFFAEK